jgi:GH35 family endo-1,4-beta-xylanase
MTTIYPDSITNLSRQRELLVPQLAALHYKHKEAGFVTIDDAELYHTLRREYNRLTYEIDTHWESMVKKPKPSLIKRIFSKH